MPKNYKVSRNLAENYKSRQNAANPNISRIFRSAGLFSRKFGQEVYAGNC